MLLSVYRQTISIKEHQRTPAIILFKVKQTRNIGTKMDHFDILWEFYKFKQKNMQFIEIDL